MSEKFGYGLGAIGSADHLFVSAVEWELEDQDVQHGVIFERSGGAWSAWSVEFRIADICFDRVRSLFFALAQTGEVEVTSITASDAWDERIGDLKDGPSDVRPINGAGLTGEFVYAVGARRQVYRRSLGVRAWSAYDTGCRVSSHSKDVRAFNKIHGLDDRELFAVGLEGEIYVCRDGSWNAADTPTNVRLDVVLQSGADRVLAGGALGSLLVGNARGFKPVVHELTRSSITGLAVAFGREFVAAEDGKLFELLDNQLSPVVVPIASEEGGGHLASTGDRMLYVRHDVVLLFDGKNWIDVTPPDDA